MSNLIQKWGNSQGIRIPKHILDELDMKVGEIVEIIAKDGTICIEKVKSKRTIKELFENYKGNYKPEEEEWGESRGGEDW